jgi:hypothetical protein
MSVEQQRWTRGFESRRDTPQIIEMTMHRALHWSTALDKELKFVGSLTLLATY